MRYFLTAIIILLATSAFAEMYIWTDEKGVKHLSNFAPPPTAKDVKVGDEITKTESQRNAEIEYNRKRRERIYAIPEKKHTKKRSYSLIFPSMRQGLPNKKVPTLLQDQAQIVPT